MEVPEEGDRSPHALRIRGRLQQGQEPNLRLTEIDDSGDGWCIDRSSDLDLGVNTGTKLREIDGIE